MHGKKKAATRVQKWKGKFRSWGRVTKQNKHLEDKQSMQNKQRISLHEEEATYMAVEKRASVSGQTIRLLQCLNRHFNLIIDVIKKRAQDKIVIKDNYRNVDRLPSSKRNLS